MIPARMLPPRRSSSPSRRFSTRARWRALLDLRGTRSRPRRARGLAGAVRRSRQEPGDLLALPRLAAPAGRAALAVRAPRRGRLDAGTRDAARGGPGGGAGIQAPRPPRAAIAAGAAAVAVALGLAAWLALAASDRAAPWVSRPAPRGRSCRRRPSCAADAAPAALVLSGGDYGLAALDRRPPLDARAASVAAALLVIGELAAGRASSRATTRTSRATRGAGRLIAGPGSGAVGLVSGLLAVVDVARSQGLAVEVARGARRAAARSCCSVAGAPRSKRLVDRRDAIVIATRVPRRPG